MKNESVFYVEGSFDEMGYQDIKITCELGNDLDGQYVAKVIKAELLIDSIWADVKSLIKDSAMEQYCIDIKEQLKELTK